MNRDGLLPEPWVSLSLRDGAALIDGEVLDAAGNSEDHYLQALRQISDEIAAPLGRPVGVRVEDSNGHVSNLAVFPDGRAEAISDLVAAAALTPATAAVVTPLVAEAAAVAPAAAMAAGATATAATTTRVSWTSRSLGIVATAAVATAVAALGLTALLSNDENAESSALRAGRVPASAPASAPAPAIAIAEPIEARPVLRARVRPHGPCAVSLRLGSTQPGMVTVRIRPADGPVVTRQVRLRGDARRLVLTDLPPGTASYKVISAEALPVRGRVRIMPPPPEASPAAATTAPTTTTTTITVSAVSAGSSSPPPSTGGSGGSGGSSGSGSGSGGSAPVVPIDPDD